MDIRLDEHEEQTLRDALHEALQVARSYRQRVADEDSILLVQDLKVVCTLLGVEEPSVAAE